MNDIFGPPKSKEGRCNKTIKFGDDFGDNYCTFRCKLLKGHPGRHEENGDMGCGNETQPYSLEWEDISTKTEVETKTKAEKERRKEK